MKDDSVQFTSLKVAFLCGAIPFFVGCGIFILWCSQGWAWLMIAGLLNIAVGLILFVAGAGHLAAHFGTIIRRRPFDKQQFALGLAAGALLLINFPTCVAILNAVERFQNQWAADLILHESSLRVINTSDHPVDSVKLSGLAFDHRIGAIPAGSGDSLFFELTNAKQLTISASQGDAIQSTSIQLPNSGADVVDIVTVIAADGSLRLVTLSPRSSALED